MNKYLKENQLVSILMNMGMSYIGYILEYDEDNIILRLENNNIVIVNSSDVYVLEIILSNSILESPKEIIVDDNISTFDIPYIDPEELPDHVFKNSEDNVVELPEEKEVDVIRLRAKKLSELHLEKIKLERENFNKSMSTIENKGTTGVSYGIPSRISKQIPSIIIGSRKKA